MNKVHTDDVDGCRSSGRRSRLAKVCVACCCLSTIAILLPVVFIVVPDAVISDFEKKQAYTVCSLMLCTGSADSPSTCQPCAGRVNSTCGLPILSRAASANRIGIVAWVNVYNTTWMNVMVDRAAVSLTSNNPVGSGLGAKATLDWSLPSDGVAAGVASSCTTINAITAVKYAWNDIKLYCELDVIQAATLLTQWQTSCLAGECEFISVPSIQFKISEGYGFFKRQPVTGAGRPAWPSLPGLR